jgi:hypothetical protein
MAFGVVSFRGNNGCIPRRQSQARSGGNRTMGLVTYVLALCTMGPSTLSTQVDANGRNLKSTTVAKVDANDHTEVHYGGKSRR